MDWFVFHALTASAAFVLIVFLALQCRFRLAFRYHKHVSILMVLFGLASLAGSLGYGFILGLDLNLYQLHNLTGFASLFTSLGSFVLALFRKRFLGLHIKLAYIAAVFAVLAMLTALVYYWDYMFGFQSRGTSSLGPSSPGELQSSVSGPQTVDLGPGSADGPDPGLATENLTCMTLGELESDPRCLFEMDGIVYDMTGMEMWQSGQHFGHMCNTRMDEALRRRLPPTHFDTSNPKYFGPVVAKLC